MFIPSRKLGDKHIIRGGDMMKGRLLSVDRAKKIGIVDTRNDNYGELTIYFQNIDDSIQKDVTVEFDVRVSAAGNTYAKFQSVVERNQAIFNTEDRNLWYEWGEDEENDFIKNVVPLMNLDIIINPEKTIKPWAIDLFDKTNNRYADLKTQNTPFFTAGRYKYKGEKYNPSFSVTFNKKDFENYLVNHSDCDIYFWVNWTQLNYKNINVEPVHGVWRASFQKMKEKIENEEVVLHAYLSRVDDDHNAKDSYVFNLLDEDVFEKMA